MRSTRAEQRETLLDVIPQMGMGMGRRGQGQAEPSGDVSTRSRSPLGDYFKTLKRDCAAWRGVAWCGNGGEGEEGRGGWWSWDATPAH